MIAYINTNMSGKPTLNSLSDWQHGFLIIFGALLVGTIVGAIMDSTSIEYGGIIGLLGGGVLFFFTIAYLFYRR